MALDIQWAHAAAPKAKIYLVEAASDGIQDLFAAVQVAKALPGVKQVSMSFGQVETACSFVQYDPVLVQSGVSFFAAAGDTPAEQDYPAESYNAVAVGGTALTVSSTGQWQSEVVWNSDGNGTGCGVSNYEPRPSFQNVVVSIVGAYRGAVDIAADADPNSGVSVYDSVPYQGYVNWQVVGGTSLATPLIAGIANAAGTSRSSSQAQNAALYGNIGTSNFHDITKGKVGKYSAGTGWDVPSGVGSPNGTGGF
jgi:subtilase family serine protease